MIVIIAIAIVISIVNVVAIVAIVIVISIVNVVVAPFNLLNLYFFRKEGWGGVDCLISLLYNDMAFLWTMKGAKDSWELESVKVASIFN